MLRAPPAGSRAAGSRGRAGRAYAAAGSYPVTVSAVDGAGNTTSRSATIAVAPAPPRPPERPRLTSLSLRIVGKDSLRRLRRSGALTVAASVDSAATATLNGRARLRAPGRARARLVAIFVPRTVSFSAAGERTVRLRLSPAGRKALRKATRARIRVGGEAIDLAGASATSSAASTLRD